MTQLVICHVVPLLFLALLYWVDLRRIRIGGGEPYLLADVLTEALALSVGSPAEGALGIFSALFAAGLAITALVLLRREGSSLWILFAITIFIAPAAMLLLTEPEILYVRYFYINILFLLVLLSFLFGRFLAARASFRSVALVLLAAIVAGNLWLTAAFLQEGRGHYLEALEYIVAHSSGAEVYVGSDHDSRNLLPLAFYSVYLPPAPRLRYQDQKTPASQVPDWVIIHSPEKRFTPSEAIRDPSGNLFLLEKVYRYAGLSGFHWAIYHHAKGAG